MPTKEEWQIAKKVWDRVFGIIYKVKSMDYRRRKEGREYEVHHKGDDTWSCSCPSWVFESGTFPVEDLETGKTYPRTCKHIRYCMEEENMKTKRKYR